MHYYGEAKVLRAMYYLELVRNWGDVPYRRKPAGNKDELFIGATDRDIILTPFGHSGIFPLSAANILTFLIRYHRQQQIFL